MDPSTTGKIITTSLLAAAIAWTAATMVSRVGDPRLAALESGQQEILKELQALKAQAPGRPVAANLTPPAPPPLPATPLSIEGAAARGNVNARLTLIEFSDFQCPFCGRHTRETFDQIERDYVKTGKVQYVFRHFPIESLHPNAIRAAVAGECARQQGKFWEMHTRLFVNQQALAEADLLAHAKAVGLNAGGFQACVATDAVAAKVRQDLDEGARAGITGTPTFFVGTLDKDGKVKVLKRLTGAQPYAAFKTTLDGLLASADIAR